MRSQVLIVGGGIAGLTLAAALGGAGLAVTLVDREAEDARTAPGFDGRTTAIALGSRRLLEGVGIWSHVVRHAEAIRDIRIADGRAPVFLHYDSREIGPEPFGHIVENRLLRRGQLERLDALPTVSRLAPAQVVDLARDAFGVTATLADGRVLKADLVVGADGAGSFVRRSAGIRTTAWRYRQTAIVATITHERPHRGLAVEHFFPAGPFAILPMTDDAEGRPRSSIVWTERADRADAFLALPADAFDAELQARIGSHLGQVRSVEGRFAHRVGVLYAERIVDRRLALISEAAHAIHPIAGQGLNLGLRGVAALAEVVVEAARLGLDVGEAEPLARYERWRRADTLTLIAVTDTLNRLFSNDIAPIRLARDLGLAAVGRMGPVRRFFMRAAMGTTGPLPRLVRGEPL